jgi:hypothetical protein
MNPSIMISSPKWKNHCEGHITAQERRIRAEGLSLLNINRSGHADRVRRLPQIWQMVVQMGGDYIEGMCLPHVIKSFQNYRGVAITFYSTLVFSVQNSALCPLCSLLSWDCRHSYCFLDLGSGCSFTALLCNHR